MAAEIERKFLVRDDRWRLGAVGVRMRQGYLSARSGCSVRVRLAGPDAWLCVKGRLEGLSRPEYEYAIPAADAEAMLASLCELPEIDKVRYCIPFGAHVWEVDEFHGANAGLVVAEIELGAEDEAFERPNWVAEEVTHDRRYLNSNLARQPWSTWSAPA